jgi:hypothetical protein
LLYYLSFSNRSRKRFNSFLSSGLTTLPKRWRLAAMFAALCSSSVFASYAFVSLAL